MNKKFSATRNLCFLFLLGVSSLSLAQTDSVMPIPGAGAARDVPGAVLYPNQEIVHRVVFDAARGAANSDEINPMLQAVARYVNTLATYGVPEENREIAIVIHQGATSIILQNEEYQARNNGAYNPNIALIRALDEAGVKLHVCGQAVLGNNIDTDTILSEIQVDLWALTTIIDYQQRGFVLIGG